MRNRTIRFNLTFLLCQFLVTFVAIVFVIFIDAISITDIITSHPITNFLYIYYSRKYMDDSNYNLFCTCGNFYIRIDMFYYPIFDLNLLNKEPNTTMQELTTKIQEQGGLKLSQVSLSMIKNSCKRGHDLSHFLLEDTLENIPIEVESGHEKDKTTDDYYTNLLFDKTKLARLKDDIVSEIKTEIKTAINEKFDKIELMKHQDESNKEHTLKKQLDSLRQDFLENNKLINHLFKEYKSLSSLLQATVSPWLPQKSQNENSNLNINSSPVCKNFETPAKNLPQISKSNRRVPPNRLIIDNKLRNNNGEVAPNKLIIDEQFKNNIQECFSKKQSKMNLENQLADIRIRKHQAFISRNAINSNDSFINQKVRDNISVIPESTETTNHKNKNDCKNANTKYKKIKKKTVLVVGDSK